jgi:hypothetical protein
MLLRAIGLFLAVVGVALVAVLSITVPVTHWWVSRSTNSNHSRREAGAEAR